MSEIPDVVSWPIIISGGGPISELLAPLLPKRLADVAPLLAASCIFSGWQLGIVAAAMRDGVAATGFDR
jgi:hypothetical protein